MSLIIDRRLNDRGKSAVNRQRFIRRYKEGLQRAIDDLVSKRKIADMDRGGEVQIPARDISEPTFRHGPGGDREVVLPGNRSFRAGDRIPRPSANQGEGDGQDAGEGEAEDNFTFALSREEFLSLFFDDLALPRMERKLLGQEKEWKTVRAGYTRRGTPANLSVPRSLRNSLARRIALRNSGHKTPFIDEIDLRYRNRTRIPEPVSRAVMFCLMDVSASMDERKKDLAKRFFSLLYIFLSRKYEHVELVFIRHTDDAEEVDENAFFHDPKSGGTVVQTALRLMADIMVKRFGDGTWNVYGAQVSDGDAFGADPEKSRALLEEELLPAVRYFAYIEVPDDATRASALSHAYGRVTGERFAMRTVTARSEVYPVLRELFRKEAPTT